MTFYRHSSDVNTINSELLHFHDQPISLAKEKNVDQALYQTKTHCFAVVSLLTLHCQRYVDTSTYISLINMSFQNKWCSNSLHSYGEAFHKILEADCRDLLPFRALVRSDTDVGWWGLTHCSSSSKIVINGYEARPVKLFHTKLGKMKQDRAFLCGLKQQLTNIIQIKCFLTSILTFFYCFCRLNRLELLWTN